MADPLNGDGRRRLRHTFLAAVAGATLFSALIPGVASAATLAAKANVDHPAQYLNDTTGTVLTFTVRNSGTKSIAAVKIVRPSLKWSFASCPSAPAGWTANTPAASGPCIYKSNASGFKIAASASGLFGVRAKTAAGSDDRGGTWKIFVSTTTSFSTASTVAQATAGVGGLKSTAYSFEVKSGVVASSTKAVGSACPAPNLTSGSGNTAVIVVCGRNRSTNTRTPDSTSQLAGTFIATKGTFHSAAVAPGSTNVVLANWTGAVVTTNSGGGKTVIAQIGGVGHTSPSTTLIGFSSVGAPPTPTPIVTPTPTASPSPSPSPTATPLPPTIDLDPDNSRDNQPDFATTYVLRNAATNIGDVDASLTSPSNNVTEMDIAIIGVLDTTGSDEIGFTAHEFLDLCGTPLALLPDDLLAVPGDNGFVANCTSEDNPSFGYTVAITGVLAGTLILHISPSSSPDTDADWQYLLRSLAYHDDAHADGFLDANLGDRTFSITATNGAQTSGAVVSTITVADPLLLDQANESDWTASNIMGNTGGFHVKWGQTFTAGATGSLEQVSLDTQAPPTSPGPMSVSIQTVSAGLPTGTEIGSGEYGGGSGFANIVLTNPAAVVAGQVYAIVLDTPFTATPTNQNRWGLSATEDDTYAGGALIRVDRDEGTSVYGGDLRFRTWVRP